MRISVGLLALAMLTTAAICQPSAGDPPITLSGFTVIASVREDGPNNMRTWVMAGEGSYGAAKSEFAATFQNDGWQVGVRDANNLDDPGVLAKSRDGDKCVALTEWSPVERLFLENVHGLGASDSDEAERYPSAITIRSDKCFGYLGAAFPE